MLSNVSVYLLPPIEITLLPLTMPSSAFLSRTTAPSLFRHRLRSPITSYADMLREDTIVLSHTLVEGQIDERASFVALVIHGEAAAWSGSRLRSVPGKQTEQGPVAGQGKYQGNRQSKVQWQANISTREADRARSNSRPRSVPGKQAEQGPLAGQCHSGKQSEQGPVAGQDRYQESRQSKVQ